MGAKLCYRPAGTWTTWTGAGRSSTSATLWTSCNRSPSDDTLWGVRRACGAKWWTTRTSSSVSGPGPAPPPKSCGPGTPPRTLRTGWRSTSVASKSEEFQQNRPPVPDSAPISQNDRFLECHRHFCSLPPTAGTALQWRIWELWGLRPSIGAFEYE